jgi:hypothetical protein
MVSHNPTGEPISDDGSARTKTDGGNNDSKINTTRKIPLFGLMFMFITPQAPPASARVTKNPATNSAAAVFYRIAKRQDLWPDAKK